LTSSACLAPACRVAGYIFGGNTPSGKPGGSESIAMTAPVIMQQGQEQQAGGSQKISMTAPVVGGGSRCARPPCAE
jgi:hypothetical protein